MEYSRDEFEYGNCPNCKSTDIEKKINWSNSVFLNGAGIWLDMPFGANYECRKCGTENSDPCFVATAVYGDTHAPQVEKLRKIRDDVLSQYTAGRAFTRFYYSGAGKKAAKIVKKHLPSTIPAIRKGLDIIIKKYDLQNKKNLE